MKEIVEFTGGYPAYLNWFGEQCQHLEAGKPVAISTIKELERKIFLYRPRFMAEFFEIPPPI